MNYLQLVQELARKADTSVPGTVTGLQGMSLKLVNWINQAWTEIQGEREDWLFMWKQSDPLVLVAGTRTYSLPIDARELVLNSVYINDGATNSYARYMTYADFSSNYRFATQEGRPSVYTKRPDGQIEFYPIPDQAYNYAFDYFKKPVTLSETTDVPAIDDYYHMAIVYKALIHYGDFELDGDLITRATRAYNTYSTQMYNKYLPNVTFGEPLA